MENKLNIKFKNIAPVNFFASQLRSGKMAGNNHQGGLFMQTTIVITALYF